jgi:hypothetical protein
MQCNDDDPTHRAQGGKELVAAFLSTTPILHAFHFYAQSLEDLGKSIYLDPFSRTEYTAVS